MYRVRIVVEAPPADGLGAPQVLELEDPFGPFSGAGATSAELDGLGAAMRVAGHLSEALEEALSFEARRGVPGPVGHPIAPPPPRPAPEPDSRCESPLAAYCSREAWAVVRLLEPADARIAVCSPCRDELVAAGVAAEVGAGRCPDGSGSWDCDRPAGHVGPCYPQEVRS